MNIDSDLRLQNLSADEHEWVTAFIRTFPEMAQHEQVLDIWFRSAIAAGKESVDASECGGNCGTAPEPSPEIPAPTITKCNLERQQDEIYCSTCNTRWSADASDAEATPCNLEGEATPCNLEDEINRIKIRIHNIQMTGKITGAEGPEYQSLQTRLRKLES